MSELLAMVLAVGLGAGLGSAQATGEAIDDDTLSVHLSVTVAVEGPVVAHLLLPGESEMVRPLANRGHGEWAATLELRRADWRVVFEVVSSGELSSPFTLTELGVAPAVVGRVDPATSRAGPEDTSNTDSTWLLSVALAAGALALGIVATSRRSRSG